MVNNISEKPVLASDEAPGRNLATNRNGGLNKGRWKQRKKMRLIAEGEVKEISPGIDVSAPAPVRRFRLRHALLTFSFLALVVAPLCYTAWYLLNRAADQFHSVVAFTVRSEEMSSPFEMLGALTGAGSSSGTDAEILFEYIQSQRIVEELDAELDLRAIYNRGTEDYIFRLGENRSVEDLHWYWKWAIDIAFDNNSGLIEITTLAFDPDDAYAIASAILRESDELVNRLSVEAREDAIRFAQADLDEAEERLRGMRVKLRAFRNENRIIDPEAGVLGLQGLLNSLEEQLAQALVDRNELRSYAAADDPRLNNAERRIQAIRQQIELEKSSLANQQDGTGVPLSEVIGRYEELLVDLEFSEDAYTSTLVAFEAARTEARRQTRYLAAHIEPTISEVAQYPRRYLLIAATAAGLLILWSVSVLLAYNIRDRQ